MTDSRHSRPITTNRRCLLAMTGAAATLAALRSARALAHTDHDHDGTPGASPVASPAASGPITISTPMGDVTLQSPAQRVVAIEWNLVEYVLALGVQPVAIADIEGYNA